MSSARNQAVVPQATGDTQYNVRDAALRGAALAFSKPPVKPKPQANTYTGADNGALLAATKVGVARTGNAANPAAPLTRDWTGGSSRSFSSRPNISPLSASSKPNSSSTLGVPDDLGSRVPSPSNIAAKLAAARFSPQRPVRQTVNAPPMSERHVNERDVLPPTGSVGNVLARLEPMQPRQQPRKRRDSLELAARSAPREAHDKPTDDTPIPPTTSLVKMFEQNRPVTPTKPSAPLNTSKRSPPPVRSPKPQRAFKLPPEPKDDVPLQRTRTHTPPPVKPKPKQRIELPMPHFTDGATQAYFNTPQKDPLKTPPIKQKPVQLAAIRTSTPPPPQPPPQRGSRQARPKSRDMSQSTSSQRKQSMSVESQGTPSSPVSFKSAKEEQDEDEKPKPVLPPPRRSNTRRAESIPPNSKPQTTAPIPFKPRNQNQSPSPFHSMEQLSPPRRPASSNATASPSVYHSNYQRQSIQQITKHMTGESLSSAIMGAALAASSRNVSPAPPPTTLDPLFPPRKHHHHHHSPFHRSPSPTKQSPPKSTGKLRTTMRKEPSSSEDEDKGEKYKKKGTRIMGIKQRKHPNKHHEGNRKRWRDQITERERKRYEGVWAANKGVLLPVSNHSPSRAPVENDPSLDVLNLCVEEIWTRSRLPTHVLEEVWDLVDGRGIGRLSRYEFVVGLWLIDQRLKGRKLPVRVSESVWASARGVGIKVKVHK